MLLNIANPMYTSTYINLEWNASCMSNEKNMSITMSVSCDCDNIWNTKDFPGVQDRQ